MPIRTCRLGPEGIDKALHLGVRHGEEDTDYMAGFLRLAWRVQGQPTCGSRHLAGPDARPIRTDLLVYLLHRFAPELLMPGLTGPGWAVDAVAVTGAVALGVAAGRIQQATMRWVSRQEGGTPGRSAIAHLLGGGLRT